MLEVASTLRLQSDVSMALQRGTSEIVNKEYEFTLQDYQKIIAETTNVSPPTYVKAIKYFIEHEDCSNIFWFFIAECEFIIADYDKLFDVIKHLLFLFHVGLMHC